MKKRILCLFLIAAMMLPLASCSETTVTEDKTDTNTPSAETVEEVEEETSPYADTLPEDLDFEGLVQNFVVEEGGNGNLSEKSIYVEEDTGDVVDSAVYNRNIVVQERLNIKINLVDTVNAGQVSSLLRTSVSSGSDDYSIVGVYQYYGISVASEGLLKRLNDLEYNDFEAPYWGTDYMNSMALKGVYFWATGDIALRYIGGMNVTYLNINTWNDNFPGQSYVALVDDGKWTLDTFNTYASAAYVDVNGDGKTDDGDKFGFVINAYEDPIETVAVASLVKFSELDENGIPHISLDSERTYSVWEKMYSLLFNCPGTFISASDDNKTTMNMFATGKAMLIINKLFQSEIYLREMSDDFSILPLPKYNEEQEFYNTMLHDGTTLFGVPLTNPNTAAASATLEAMASESYQRVTPAYFDKALKYKYTRDADSARMIDLVKENIQSDFACMWSGAVTDIAHYFRNQALNQNVSIASSIQKSQKAWDKSLEKIVSKLQSVSDKQDG